MRISDWSSDVCSSDLRTVKFIEIRLGVLARAQAGYLEHLTRRERFRLDNAPLYEALVRSLAGGDLQSLESQIGEFDRILALETEPRRRRPLMESAGRSRKKWAARWLGVVHSREFQAAWRLLASASSDPRITWQTLAGYIGEKKVLLGDLR